MVPENIRIMHRDDIVRISIGIITCILLMAGSALGASFHLSVTVNASGFERIDKPVEVSVNFTQLLDNIGQSGTIDNNSIYVAEINDLGTVIDTSIASQFDKDPGYDPTTNASGTIVFIMKGTTPANGNRSYYIYFNTGGSSSPILVTRQVTLTDNVIDEGQSSYKISNIDGTFFFQKDAGGFSSWTDISGNDWISWNTASGPSGKYRGIPNAVNPEAVFHPGFTCCTSSIISQGPIKVRIRSVNNTKWESVWDFYPKYATMTMIKADHNYWFLYEGTPGGVFEPNKDFMFRSNGIKTYLNASWTGDILNNEWTYFSDPTVERSLFGAHHEDDTLKDSYWPYMYMTVFGFGRGNSSDMTKYMSYVPQHFTIGFMDGTDFTQNSKLIYSAYKDLTITKGIVEQYDDTSPPIIVTQPINKTVIIGQSASFSVGATGKLPLSYRWQKNGTNISGATVATYNTSPVTMADNGTTFRVIVTNSEGSTISNSATLTVMPASQLTLLDVTYNHTNSTKAFSFFNLPSGIPSNLISPIDYAHGRLYQRIQVITKPSNKIVKYQVCIFQDYVISSKHACSNLIYFAGLGTYYANQNMTTMFQYKNISWDRSLLKEMLVVKDINGKPVDDRYGWDGTWNGSPDFNLYYPMNVRYTAIIVSPGGGVPIWPPDDTALSIISSSPTTDPTTVVGTAQTFNMTVNKNADITWRIDGSIVNTETGVMTSNYTNYTTNVGIHTVNATARNRTETKSREWTWTVQDNVVSITIISPNGGENWINGTTNTIRWSYNGDPGPFVEIGLLKGTTLDSVTPNIPIGSSGTGSYDWPVPSAQILGNDYKVLITSMSNSAYNDASNNNFTISAGSISPNIIRNPGFESGNASWSFYTNGIGTFGMISPGYEGTNAAKLNFNSGGTNIQLYQTGIRLEPSTRYRLTLVARSTAAHDLTIKLSKHVSPYTNYGLSKTFDIGTSWQTFTTEFTTTGFTSIVSDGRFQFWLAPFVTTGDVYYIDNIRLEKI